MLFRRKKKGLPVNPRLRDPEYVEQRFRDVYEKIKRWEHFNTFECSEFYRGKTMATLNREKYIVAIVPLWKEERILANIISRRTKGGKSERHHHS